MCNLFYPTLVQDYNKEVIQVIDEQKLNKLKAQREELLNEMYGMAISNPRYAELENDIEYLDELINNLEGCV